jgi:hypothetical protein
VTADNTRHGLPVCEIEVVDDLLDETLTHRNSCRPLAFTALPIVSREALFPLGSREPKVQHQGRSLGPLRPDTRNTFAAIILAARWCNSLLPKYWLPRRKRWALLAADGVRLHRSLRCKKADMGSMGSVRKFVLNSSRGSQRREYQLSPSVGGPFVNAHQAP